MQELFLEDVLRLTGFNNKDKTKYKEETQRGKRLICYSLRGNIEWCPHFTDV